MEIKGVLLMPQYEWGAACHFSGTCALTGSATFFVSIPGSYVMVNGPLWCYFYAMRHVESVIPGVASRFYCTQPSQTSLIYGTEQDLNEGFEYLKKNVSPERLFIQNNCSISMVGDDLKGIAAKAKLPYPVYTIDSGGLSGSFEGGYSKALVLVVNEMKAQKTVDNSVNILGLSNTIFRGMANGKEITRLLEESGISVISTPGLGDKWEQIMEAPKAALNVVVRDELGLSAAEKMKEIFGIPYISIGLPFGIDGTIDWLSQVKKALPGLELSKVECEAKEKKEKLKHIGSNNESMWGPLWFDRILVSAPPSEAMGIADAIRNEWVDTEKLIIHFLVPCDLNPRSADIIRNVGKDDQGIKEDYDAWVDGLVLGSSHEAARLIRLQKKFMSINITRPSYNEVAVDDLPICGLRGAEYLFGRLWNVKLFRRMEEQKT